MVGVTLLAAAGSLVAVGWIGAREDSQAGQMVPAPAIGLGTSETDHSSGSPPGSRPGSTAWPPQESTLRGDQADGASGQQGAGSPCSPFPEFPNASCTGWEHTGVTLDDCPAEVTEAGAELDGCRFEGGVRVKAPDVTISRSLVEGFVWPDGDLQGLVLVDVEIDAGGRDDRVALGTSNFTCIRCHIHGIGRSSNLVSNVHIESSYVTGIGSNGGSGFTIVHNSITCSGCSAALWLWTDFAPIDDVLVERNLFNTTGSYCTYAGTDQDSEHPPATNVRYLDNRFGTDLEPDCGRHGPVTSWGDGGGNQWQGNEWADGSGPVIP